MKNRKTRLLLASKRTSVSILILLFVSVLHLSGQKTAYTMTSVQDSINRQLSLFPQEKIHLQTDRNIYVPGEKIWFKAYLTNGANNQPATHSRYVYAELISPADSIVNRVMIRQDEDNMYHGHLFLSDMIPEGTYTIRAYTRHMENLGEDYYFTKNIQIKNIPNEASAKKQTDRERNARIRRDDFDVALLPEGGNLIDGKMCRVAFKALNRDGTSDYITGRLLDEKGKLLSTVKTFYAGMGSFYFIPEKGKKYYLECTNRNGTEKKFELPACQSAHTVRSAWRRHDNIHLVTVEKSDDIPEQQLYLLTYSSGVVLHFSEWNYRNRLISFKGDELPSGIIQFVLFDAAMNPMSERLVFNKNMAHDKAEILFSTDKYVYEKRDKVTAGLTLTDYDGKLLQGNLSVSITDDSDMEAETQTTILSTLLLSSELKGHIETPAYYLENTLDSEIALNMLMMTHGWRRYNIPEVVRGVYENPKTDFETSKKITGIVKSMYRGRPMVDSDVSIISSIGEYDIVKTDESGHFGLFDIEYTDSVRFMVKAANQKGNENVELIVDKEIFPKPTHAHNSPVLKMVEVNTDKNTEYNNSTALLSDHATGAEDNAYDFINKATRRAQYDENIRTIYLDEVVVTARRPVAKRDEIRLEQWQNRSSDGTIYRERIKERAMVDVFQAISLIPGVRVSGETDEFGLPTGQRAVAFSRGRVTVYIDGFKADGFDLEALNINTVDAVDYFRGMNAGMVWGALSGGDFAINITTNYDDSYDNYPRYNHHVINPLGFQAHAEFYSPKYDTPEAKNLSTPDYRSTIFWKPDISVTESGKASFEFYTSDFPTTYSVVVEGISTDGKIIRHVDKINVK